MDPMIIGVIVVVGLLIVAGLVYVGLREERGGDPLQARLAQIGGERETPESLEEVELSLSFKDRIIVPVINWIAQKTAKLTPQEQLEASRKKIEQAGLTTDPTQFFLSRIIFGIVFFVISVFALFVVEIIELEPIMALGGVVMLTAMGFYYPVSRLTGKIKKRQDQVVKALPDALDLLVICVEAGLGFDMAMGKVYDKWENEVSLAFGRVLREIQLGKPRREAMRDMADRLDVPDMNSFVAAIIQADQLGVSMSRILKVQSEQMRIKRRQRAQEKAQQAPVKMMLPMVFLIFPSIWIVLLGPAILKVMAVSGSTGAF